MIYSNHMVAMQCAYMRVALTEIAVLVYCHTNMMRYVRFLVHSMKIPPLY